MKKVGPLNNPIILALDVDTDTEALRLTDELSEVVGGIKLGPRLCVRYGKELIKRISERAPVFVDNKYFDIPSTTLAAVEATFEAGASLVTVHALNGPETLGQLAKLEAKLNQQRPFKILCVTVLTSFSQEHLSKSFKNENLVWHVKNLSEEVKASGLTGLVCSAQDLSEVSVKDFFVVTPGIRMEEHDKGDQKRVMGPEQALKAGAKALVVGRPILQAKNPRETATEFVMACYPDLT
jgi:orotidine-5'-phosphate decarboxylase